MVGEKEYSRLQGYMGKQYALASGEPQAVAEAIFEHYLPRFAEDRLPQSLPGSVVALADKVDTVVGCFGIGLLPTGSQDPYALRRGALGVIRILLFNRLQVDLSRLVDRSLELLADRLKAERAAVREGAWAFFRQRLEGQLGEMGLDRDVVEAVLAADDRLPVEVLGRATALQGFRARPGFPPLVQAAKRVANILRGQEVAGQLDAGLFPGQAEQQLLRATDQVGRRIVARTGSGDYGGALEATLELVAPIDAFFDQILVMDPDLRLRANRLRLLAGVRDIFLAVADYSRIVLRAEEQPGSRE
jgi:glycyl-tRNA synthetase beta chain